MTAKTWMARWRDRQLAGLLQKFDVWFWTTINKRRPFDYERFAYAMAAQEAAAYFVQHMRMTPNLHTKNALLAHVLADIGTSGMWLEFGVARGKDIRLIASATQQSVYGFDSFQGLPEDWTHFQRKGRFSTDGLTPAQLPTNVQLVKGLFEATLPAFLQQHQDPVAFLHIDSDLYSSADFVLRSLVSRLQPGCIILFDDFLNYPGWQFGEAKAWHELVATHNIGFEHVGFASEHHSIAVKILVNPGLNAH